MYLPAMVFFTLLSKVTAFKALTAFHLGLAGLSMYALARTLKMGVLGALAAGIAFEFGAFTQLTGCCTVSAQASAWFPLSLIGIELAVKSETWLSRSAWWSVIGLAISQMLAGWLGQGAYYGLMVVGGYVAYRTVIVPPPAMRSLRARLVAVLLNGVVVLIIGFGLAAAGVLPRLEVIDNSTLKGGDYRGVAAYVADSPGWSPELAFARLLSMEAGSQLYYAGGSTIALAILAPLIARRRFSVPFFTVISIIAIVLMFNATIVHRVLYLLPRFQLLHEHLSYRVFIVLYFGIALLSGATISALVQCRNRRFLGLSAVFGLVILLAGIHQYERDREPIDQMTIWSVGIVGGLVLLYAILNPGWLTKLVPIGLIVMLFVDPLAWQIVRDRNLRALGDSQAQELLATYVEPAKSAQFLLDRTGLEPARFFGYEQALINEPRDPERFNGQYRAAMRQMLVLNVRGLYIGLEDLQGYNPVQNGRYNGFIQAMNREPQNYHVSYVLPGGLGSPLLNVLNSRYIIVPTKVPPGRPDLFHMTQRFPTVYTDPSVRILKNEDAFPRAWIVHEARQVAEGEALPLMTSGQLDLRTTAVLETDPPPLEVPADATADEVTVERYEPDRIQLTASTDASGLLMLSEIYDPGWKAYVDGDQVDLYVADHALRAVPLPPGQHEIELRYEPRSLQVGLAISGFTSLGVLGIWLMALARRLRDRSATSRRQWALSRSSPSGVE